MSKYSCPDCSESLLESSKRQSNTTVWFCSSCDKFYDRTKSETSEE